MYLKLILIFISSNLYIFANPTIQKAVYEYKEGNYQEAIRILEQEKFTSQKYIARKYYLIGVANNKLQHFDKSIDNFKKAIKAKAKYKDLYYEYAQALYAASELEKARDAFRNSYHKKFKIDTSLYYMGHISQILEQFKAAKRIYSKLIKTKSENTNIIQLAHFQLGETLLSLSEKKKNTARPVEKYVLPRLEKAINIDPTSSLKREISKRISEIKKKYGLDPNLMKNGKTLPDKRYAFSYDQAFEYDNNVTSNSDEPTQLATQKDSYIFTSTLEAKYTFSFFGRLISVPKIRVQKVSHSDQDNSDVFTNDSLTLTSSLSNKIEHTLLGQQASTIFNFDFTKLKKDRNKVHKRIFYSDAFTYTLGLSFKYFSFGKSTIKYKRKNTTSYDAPLDSSTDSFSFDQIAILPNKTLLIVLISTDRDRVQNNTDSTNTYTTRADWIIPNIFPKYTLNLAYSHTFLDTMKKKSTRGTEQKYNPSIKITKSFNDHLDFNLSYDYTKNNSKNRSDNAYSKHQTKFEFSLGF